ncbi:lipid-binding protein [Pontibacter russatus]|uniref:lipid-binding protein n=1 Tax=Pontibacter russatus TaxID=2694929 RepID=UPI0013797D29|nr:lipid-binding protein [Pontibacter russatus]
MKKTYLYFLAILLSVGFLSSCERDAPEIEYTSTFPVSGEWWVTYKVETSPGVFVDAGGGYSTLLTYNTSDNSGDSIWIDDQGHFWTYKVKAPVNMQNLTFGVEEAPNAAYESMVTIADGKVLLNAAESKTGVQTDSIYFKVSFSDEEDEDENVTPYNTIYHVSGHRRTGFLEDDF